MTTTVLLTPGLKDDFELLKDHPEMTKAIGENIVERISTTDHSSYMLDVLYDGVRYSDDIIDSNLRGDVVYFIARTWNYAGAGYQNQCFLHRNDGKRGSDAFGRWMYLYASVYKNTLYVSKFMFSGFSEIINNETQYYYGDKKISSTDIVNAKDIETFHLMIPGNKEMFHAEEVAYKIPLPLLYKGSV